MKTWSVTLQLRAFQYTSIEVEAENREDAEGEAIRLCLREPQEWTHSDSTMLKDDLSVVDYQEASR
jgi:hypothetical protein